jgi:hypothetical protein
MLQSRSCITGLKHANKAGLVTVAGHPWGRASPRHAEQHLQRGGTQAMKLLIIVEQTHTGYSAYSPDFAGLRRGGTVSPRR